MDAHKLIALFGEESGVPLTLGESGTIDLIFDNDVTVTLEHDDPQDMLHAYAVLGQEPVEADQRLTLYRDMLSANAFGHETEGAALSLDDRTGEILLTRRLELADATVIQLRRTVESMVDVSLSWREKLATVGHAAPVMPSMAAKPAPPGNSLRA
ncbi:hypothetical protein CAL12_22170 [Bordetella genomosp. 8]|uniref:Type III secretion system chaperone n=1 Tax=Bordetella genomosp. 8 TaxID=1416806 RepID=A0A1W6YQG3_9BORD|nr:type III secretion system chaperone [Bordetella genomosp. 8]ARP83258.1 hypothetical protein CAL12_22170 [Bordetella genomosp. 8]